LAEQNRQVLLVDGFLHALVEKNPRLSAKRFMAYNLPSIMSHLAQSDREEAVAAELLASHTARLAKKSRILSMERKR